MTKYLTSFRTMEEYESLKELSDGFILGVKGLSVYYPEYEEEEMKQILSKLKKEKKEIFLSVNKNMHNKDLEYLKKVLRMFEKEVTAFLYYDISVVEIKKELQLKTPLVWAQEHFTTNYNTMNYWNDFGALYTFLSGEITLREVKEIQKHSKSKLIVPIFGRIPMFVSKRHLIKNYFQYFKKEYENGNYTIRKEGNIIPIEDRDEETIVYSGCYLNGLLESLELQELEIPYFYLNPYGIKESQFYSILKNYKEANKENAKEKEGQIDTLLEGNTDKGFLYKETVYKVK